MRTVSLTYSPRELQGFDMKPLFHWDNSYSRLSDRMYTRTEPAPAPSPQLLGFNPELGAELGMPSDLSDQELADIFSGKTIPDGASPIAQAYAGHQFGNFVPSLGDGRAVLLGEAIDLDGNRRDIQLKGSGRTPFSRGGDGKAWIGPILREYVVSEAMHSMGIATTRALAAVRTGETIVRAEGYMPGAVVTRVASSHIRVGTFQFFAARGDREAVQSLYEYSVGRHYQNCSTPLDFLNAVIANQAYLIAKWLGVGFIHGVMNTDNTTISGETIDYGPCAFMDRYHPATVFSSIDRHGRYAFSNQPDIIVWNIAQLASSLLLLEDDQDTAIEVYTQAVHKMPDAIEAARIEAFSSKLGISESIRSDALLIDRFLEILAASESDFTNSFRGLSDETTLTKIVHPDMHEWAKDWSQRLSDENNPETVMNASNPAYIPRNHRIEEMIQAALNDDLAPFKRLNRVLSDPFNVQAGEDDLRLPPTKDQEVEATFCGT